MELILAFRILVTILITLGTIITLRILTIQPSRRPRPTPRKRGSPTHLLIVLGSGGHTAEMIAMLRHAAIGREKQITTDKQNIANGTNGSKTRKGGTGKQRSPVSSKGTEIYTEGTERNPQNGEGTLDWTSYTHRTWVVSSGDSFSAARAQDFENEIAARISTPTAAAAASATENEPQGLGSYTITTVPRARKIHQPLLTTPLSSLQCLWSCIQLLLSPSSSSPPSSPEQQQQRQPGYPDLILTNGPATATILVLASLLLRFFDVRAADSAGKMRTVYVESWARVKKMSLSGRILSFVVDRVVVQWVQLQGGGGGGGGRGRGEFLGVLV